MVKAYDKGGEAFEPCPAGNHAARVCEIIFLGTVHESFKGEEKDTLQIKIGFEVPGELRENGTPHVVGTFPITLSMNKKAHFRKLVQGIVTLTPETEKEFDASELMGKECLINVIHKPSKADPSIVYANITGASPLPKGMIVGPAVTEQFNFDVTTSSAEDLAKLPEFLRVKIESTPEWKARNIF